MNNVKLSIVIPVYNIEKYIGYCLDSIINQDVDKNQYEVICVDDGSTDNSLQILKQYESVNQNIKVFHKENGGVCSARNFGIDKSSGKYICFLDGDDRYPPPPNGLSKLFSALGPDIVQFNMTKVEENFEEINKNCDISQYLLEMCGDLLWNKIFKSSIIKSNNIRFIETMYYAEDIFFVFHYLCFVKSKTILLDFVYLYRQRNNSAIHTRNKAKYIKQVESLKQFCSIGIEKLLPLTNDNNDAKKALQLKLSENANMLLYLSPLTNEKKKACFNFTKENKLHPHTKQIVKSCQKLKYKIKYSLIGLLKYRLIYYIYFDLVKIVLKIKKYN